MIQTVAISAAKNISGALKYWKLQSWCCYWSWSTGGCTARAATGVGELDSCIVDALEVVEGGAVPDEKYSSFTGFYIFTFNIL